jgi:hypothetical protein
VHLGPLYVGGDKGGVNPLLMMLFRDSDKRIRRLQPTDPDAAKYIDPDITDRDDIDIVQYAASAEAIRDRLELMGFTLSTSLRVFDAAVLAARRRHTETMGQLAGHLPPDFEDDTEKILAELTANDWMNGLRTIRDLGLRPTYRTDDKLEHLPPLIRYMLGNHFDGWYGFPGGDVRHVIRLALEVCPSDELIYDLTDLVLGGDYDSSDDVVADADYLLTEDFAVTRRVVVLTEGAIDKWILERSLKVLYPHLSDFYSFMDFEGARVAGGAVALAGMVKAFVGSGILNRMVALFDNDTAGTAAIRTLERVRMPRNIVPLQYPPLPLAEHYPTIGPSGIVAMNVNGLAASIEIYLGSDVLTDSNILTPVQWRGFDDSLQQYQGEIMDKRAVHERFARKLRDCEADRQRVDAYDWVGIRLILGRLRSAFHEADEQDLLAMEQV